MKRSKKASANACADPVLPDKCLVDTNVPIIANQASRTPQPGDRPDECVKACINAILHVIDEKRRGLILDANGEILKEYRKNLKSSGQPGVGDHFLKWVLTYQSSLPEHQIVPINKRGDSYEEFPLHEKLKDFDRSDQKFIAVANAYGKKKKAPILQATDSKWWGWKEALSEVGIEVIFLCPEYVERKFTEKFPNHERNLQ
ncbi:MAG: PIN domain-containing protein [Lentisphaerae bacterium]|nr:PIN domain-containing protein [Lentisphaerota bacterium]OQC16767.1 MAG: hypothetical protein BWX73_00680 [Lentisphaerae bacterium ADurb.Bin082]HQL86387.1 PIN domain-containing protein [Lentisphaeria bacterium]